MPGSAEKGAEEKEGARVIKRTTQIKSNQEVISLFFIFFLIMPGKGTLQKEWS